MSEKEMNKDFSYFYKLELEGINCFKDKQMLDLSDSNGNHMPWTIILGDNGTGKTTLLRVIDRMQPNALSSNNDLNYDPLIENEYKFRDKIYFKISLKLKNDIRQYSHKIVEEILYIDTEGTNDFPFLLSYGASRRMSKTENLIRDFDYFKKTSLFDESIELINAEEWLLQKELLSEKAESSVKKDFNRQLKQINQLLINILPDVQDIRIKPIVKSNSKLKIEVETDYGWVNLRDLSFGYQTLTALIVDIAAKMMDQYPSSENPLAEPVIILIDEIDLHLHPKWQRTVLDKLSEHFPAAQFIATSHSPLIVQAAQDRGANIVVCRKDGDRVIIDNDPEEVKGWRVDQILVSDLFNTEGSRSNEVQQFISEKNNILSKRNLAKEDRERLEYINLELEKFPSATGKKDMEAEDIIKRAAQLLKK